MIEKKTLSEIKSKLSVNKAFLSRLHRNPNIFAKFDGACCHDIKMRKNFMNRGMALPAPPPPLHTAELRRISHAQWEK